MRKFITAAVVSALMSVASLVFAGDKEHLLVSGISSTAVATASSPAMNGYIDRIWIPVPTMTTWTGLVTIVTATNGTEIVYSNTITSSTMTRPFIVRNTIGGTVSNVADRFYMQDDKLKASVTVSSTGTVTKASDFIIWLTDK